MKHPTCRLRVLVSSQRPGNLQAGVGVLETSRGSPLTEPDKRSGAGSWRCRQLKARPCRRLAAGGRLASTQPCPRRLPSSDHPIAGVHPSRELRVRLWFRFMVELAGAGLSFQRACVSTCREISRRAILPTPSLCPSLRPWGRNKFPIGPYSWRRQASNAGNLLFPVLPLQPEERGHLSCRIRGAIRRAGEEGGASGDGPPEGEASGRNLVNLLLSPSAPVSYSQLALSSGG